MRTIRKEPGWAEFEMGLGELETYLRVNFPVQAASAVAEFKRELKSGCPPKVYRVMYYMDRVSVYSLDPAKTAAMLTQMFKVIKLK